LRPDARSAPRRDWPWRFSSIQGSAAVTSSAWAPALPGAKDGIVAGNKRWQWGLTWDQIDRNHVLRKPTSKSNGEEWAEHDLRQYPDVIAELNRIPKHERVGPVVVDESSRLP